MNKTDVNYWVDFTLLFAFLTVGTTGLIKLLFFLNGITFGLPVRIFNKIHDLSGLVMVILVAVHLILHWNWIVCMTKKKFGAKKK